MSYSRHLIIDGYNVIHALDDLRQAMRYGQEAARGKLMQMVRVIHDEDSYRVSVVFDGRGERIEIERPGAELTFSILYAPAACSADAVIEQLVCSSATPQQITVVTHDRMISDAICAAGAVVQTPQDLESWVRRSEVEQRRRLQQNTNKVTASWRVGIGPFEKRSLEKELGQKSNPSSSKRG